MAEVPTGVVTSFLFLPASALHGCAGVVIRYSLKMYGLSIQVRDVNVRF